MDITWIEDGELTYRGCPVSAISSRGPSGFVSTANGGPLTQQILLQLLPISRHPDVLLAAVTYARWWPAAKDDKLV